MCLAQTSILTVRAAIPTGSATAVAAAVVQLLSTAGVTRVVIASAAQLPGKAAVVWRNSAAASGADDDASGSSVAATAVPGSGLVCDLALFADVAGMEVVTALVPGYRLTLDLSGVCDTNLGGVETLAAALVPLVSGVTVPAAATPLKCTPAAVALYAPRVAGADVMYS